MKTIEKRRGNLHLRHWMAALLTPCQMIVLLFLICSQDAFAETQSVPLFLSASNDFQQGFVRVVNRSDESGDAVIHAIDDSGRRFGPVRLALDAGATKHFNSGDLETGNPDKGLAQGTSGGQGDWRLEFESDLDIEVLAYVRTVDGFLTSMHDLVPEADGRHRVAIFNPGSNRSQESRLRLINPGAEDAEVTIAGLDDAGAAGAGEVHIAVPAGEARNVTAPQLESGHRSFAGRLGDGAGKWRLSITTSAAIQAMSLLETPTGHLTNLSTTPVDAPSRADEAAPRRQRTVPLFLSASNDLQQGFVRVVNRSDESGEAVIHAIDDSGRRFGPVRLALDAGATKHFNSGDLETGNPDKGLAQGVGGGQGDWRLEFESDLDIEVLAYVRTVDGFLTSMHDLVPEADGRHRVVTFNPGSNRSQESLLRLVNSGAEDAEVAIRGIDDAGAAGADEVCIQVPAGGARTIAASQLESGHEDFTGRLGDGAGKWRLSISTSASIQAMSLLRSPTGHLTNLSTSPVAAFAAAGSDNLNCGAGASAPVEIPDIDLRAAIETALGKDSGETISAAEMATLTEFDTMAETRFFKITSLAGLEYATSLRKLDLGGEHLSDLSPLSGLTELWELDLSGNLLSDLSPLSGLTGLRILDLHKNYIWDLSPLSGLTDLQWLFLNGNYISDLSPLSGLNSLVLLFLSDNFILSDISVLSNMPHLFSLELRDNAISDVSPLSGLPKLFRLSLSGNAISDISQLSDLPSLDHLDLSNNEISVLPPLSGLPDLDHLDLSGNAISDVSPLSGLPDLDHLDLSGNAISVLPPLSDLPSLDHLDLSGNAISVLPPLSDLPQLKYLDLSDNEISVLSPLSGLPDLDHLDLSGNAISDVSPLSGLPERLYKLDLSDNEISDLSSVSDLPTIFFLYLSGNKISDLSPLSGRTSGRNGLLVVHLQNNAISDLSPLSDLPQLESLHLSGNAISDLSPLSDMTELSILTLSGNAISDLSPLSGKDRLWRLELNDNEISDISPLSGLPTLYRLLLSGNAISDISPLSGLPKLYDLDLSGNAISDISPLSGLPKLYDLDLSGNAISDLSPLSSLPNLQIVDLTGDAVSETSKNTIIPALRDRGVTVNLGIMPDGPDAAIHNDNVLVMNVTEDFVRERVALSRYTNELYRWFEDAFDYLIFINNYAPPRTFSFAGFHTEVSNTTKGLGLDAHYSSGFGSAGKLKGIVFLTTPYGMKSSLALHELQHQWTNFAVRTSHSTGGHWGVSSANGVHGGFDLATLANLGDGKYRTLPFGLWHNGHDDIYSPIELYFAGYIPPEEVPNLWVGIRPSGERPGYDTLSGRASEFNVRHAVELSIDDIIAKNGARVPDSSTAQRHYRAAAILLNPPPDQAPVNSQALQELSENVSIFSYAGNDNRAVANYFEATGGRGSITMDGLSQFRKAEPGLPTLPASFGKPPPPQYCVRVPMQNGGGFMHLHPTDHGVRPWVVAHSSAPPQHSRASLQAEDDGGWRGELQKRLKARADREAVLTELNFVPKD